MPRPLATGYQGFLNPGVDAVIPINTQETAEIDCKGFTLCGIFVPASFTGSALTFEAASSSGGTYVPVKSTVSGTALSYAVAAGQFNAIDPKDFLGIRYLKIKSGSSETAARTLTCALKGL